MLWRNLSGLQTAFVAICNWCFSVGDRLHRVTVALLEYSILSAVGWCFLRVANAFNREFDRAERLLWVTAYLFRLRSINNGIHTEMRNFTTDAPLKPACKYMCITDKIPNTDAHANNRKRVVAFCVCVSTRQQRAGLIKYQSQVP